MAINTLSIFISRSQRAKNKVNTIDKFCNTAQCQSTQSAGILERVGETSHQSKTTEKYLNFRYKKIKRVEYKASIN